uniref:Uncharacterized protein n=1 Tax=Steinernema glaseri TaxID=37863 RepID=A0A1I7YFN9_9BILA
MPSETPAMRVAHVPPPRKVVWLGKLLISRRTLLISACCWCHLVEQIILRRLRPRSPKYMGFAQRMVRWTRQGPT